jgi:hypothetical protein
MTSESLARPPPPIATRSSSKEVLVAGMALGAIGGAAMLAWLMIDAALHHASPLTPLRLFGGTLLGPEALTGGVGSLLPGLLLHLVISAVLGLPFAALVPRNFPVAAAAVLGIGYAFAVMVLMTAYIVPAANPLLDEHMASFGGAWVLGRALYGAMLGFAPALRRHLSRAAPGAP